MPLKIIFYPAISLDGYIAKSNGDSDWVTDEDEQIFAEEVARAGCVIVGRRTFEQYKGKIYPMANATTFVCTSHKKVTQDYPADQVVRVSGDVEDIVKQIESRGFTSAILSGGGDTNSWFAIAGLIDEMIVSVYPKMLGAGIGLFGRWDHERGHFPIEVQLNLTLLNTRQLGDGVVQHRYKVIN
jgi:dihydrofolate reductase